MHLRRPVELTQDCAVPENIHTPPTEGIGISWGVEGSVRPEYLKKCMKLNWNFQRGGGSEKKSLLWERYGYFLELHISKKFDFSLVIPDEVFWLY